VLSGRFEAGDRLPPERDLAESLGVSRPVVHAALVELERRGLVRVESRRGAFVEDWRRSGSTELLLSMMNYADGDLSKGLFDGLLEMRLLLESETARLAARRRTEAQLGELERVAALELVASHEPYDPRRVAVLDYDFHLAVAIASGNDVYPLVLNSFKRVYGRILERFYRDPSVVGPVFAYHRRLVDAIASRDQAGALEVMSGILEYGERNLRRILVIPGDPR